MNYWWKKLLSILDRQSKGASALVTITKDGEDYSFLAKVIELEGRTGPDGKIALSRVTLEREYEAKQILGWVDTRKKMKRDDQYIRLKENQNA
jgi:hypothetical protein